MTIRYFPLFFVNDYHVGPGLLMGVYLTISVSTSICALLMRWLADRYLGRIPAIFCVRFVGTVLLMYMAVVPTNTPASSLALMLAIFALRNSCMNSTLGMSRSVIMDCVSKETRAKWAAVESFANFTWAGSATLGGYLADAHGYKFTFLITAVLHFTACLILIPAWVGSHDVEVIVMKRSREHRLKERIEKERKQGPTRSKRSLSTKAERSRSVAVVSGNLQADDEETEEA